MNVTKQQFVNRFMCSFPSHPDDPIQLPDDEDIEKLEEEADYLIEREEDNQNEQ